MWAPQLMSQALPISKPPSPSIKQKAPIQVPLPILGFPVIQA